MATYLEERKAGTVQTTDATVTTIITCAVPDNTVMVFTCRVAALKSDGSQGAGYQVVNCYRRTGGGAPVEVGSHSALVTIEDDASWGGVDDAVSGNNIIVRVTGKAGTTINWWAYGSALIYTP